MYMTWDGLLAAFGGIFGLCLGGSVISLVEMVYYFTLRLYNRANTLYREGNAMTRQVSPAHSIKKLNYNFGGGTDAAGRDANNNGYNGQRNAKMFKPPPSLLPPLQQHHQELMTAMRKEGKAANKLQTFDKTDMMVNNNDGSGWNSFAVFGGKHQQVHRPFLK